MSRQSYIDRGSGYFEEFVEFDQEFNTDDFKRYAVDNNKAGIDWERDLNNLDKHEVLRLARNFYLEENSLSYPGIS